MKKIADVYNFELDLHKVDESDGTSLAGACFVLQNADGEYRTVSRTWSKERTNAQVVTTNEKGAASFVGLGAGTYTLTETMAPRGYDLLAEPIAVKLDATDLESSERTFTVATTSPAAKVTSVDAGTGVATVEVEDPKSKTPDGGNPGNPSTTTNITNTGGSSPISSIAQTVRSVLPTTADPLVLGSSAALAVAVGLLVIGARSRRAERRSNGPRGKR